MGPRGGPGRAPDRHVLFCPRPGGHVPPPSAIPWEVEVIAMETAQKALLSALLRLIRGRGLIGEETWTQAEELLRAARDLPPLLSPPGGGEGE